jgi:hypothetical protein
MLRLLRAHGGPVDETVWIGSFKLLWDGISADFIGCERDLAIYQLIRAGDCVQKPELCPGTGSSGHMQRNIVSERNFHGEEHPAGMVAAMLDRTCRNGSCRYGQRNWRDHKNCWRNCRAKYGPDRRCTTACANRQQDIRTVCASIHNRNLAGG